MKIVTSDQMREIEQRAAAIGLPPEVLMENAGLAVAQEIKSWLGNIAGRHILILIGPGNNGGDGLVTARHLHDWGADVHPTSQNQEQIQILTTSLLDSEVFLPL